MCAETKPRIELLFQDVEDPFLQDIEDMEDIYPQYTQQDTPHPNNIQKILDFITVSLPYIFIIQSTNIYVVTDIDAFFLICNTLIYGMIITINQLHDKTSLNYLPFVLYISIVVNYNCFISIYGVPLLIEYIFKKNNNMITYLVEHYGIIQGNHIYWSFIIWIWLLVYPNIYDIIITMIV